MNDFYLYTGNKLIPSAGTRYSYIHYSIILKSILWTVLGQAGLDSDNEILLPVVEHECSSQVPMSYHQYSGLTTTSSTVGNCKNTRI